MDTVSIAEIETHLNEFVARAEAGEEITITRDGRPVARLISPPPARIPLDVEAMRHLTASMSMTGTGAADLVRRIRDSDRY